MRPALLALALAALARPAAASAPPALDAVARDLAREVGPPLEGRRALLLEVDARAPALREPLAAALEAALSAAGYAVTPWRGSGDPEARARASGQDWLLRVRGGLAPGSRELAAVGELIPTWRSFFLQRRPDARAIPPRVVNARAPADPQTLLLAPVTSAPGAPFASVETLARVPGRVVALAVGEPEPGRAAIVALTPDALIVLSAAGGRIAERSAEPLARPVRDAFATVAIGDFGGGRIALRRAGAARGEVFALRGDRLEAAGALDAAPLCSGDAGRLFGAFEPETGVLRDVLSPLVDPGAPPRSSRTLYGAACAPHGGPVAFAALGTDLRLELLGPDLRPVATPAPLPTGSGFALADLDGDGTAEVVASSPDPSQPERIRVLAPLAGGALRFETTALEGTVLAVAGGDLTADGLDDAVVAVLSPGGESTTLLLVTTDPFVVMDLREESR